MLEDFSFFCFKALTRKEGKGRRTPGQTRGKKDTDDSVQRQLKYLKKHSTKPSTAGEASLCIYIYIYSYSLSLLLRHQNEEGANCYEWFYTRFARRH